MKMKMNYHEQFEAYVKEKNLSIEEVLYVIRYYMDENSMREMLEYLKGTYDY